VARQEEKILAILYLTMVDFMENVIDVNQQLQDLQPIIEPLKKRGLSIDLLEKLGAKSIKGRGGDSLLAQPFTRLRKTYAYKVRPMKSGDQFWIGDKEQRGKYFFNEDILRADSINGQHPLSFPLVITEGELDCCIAIQCGHKAISVPNGANTKSIPLGHESSSSAFVYIENAMNLLKVERVPEIILATDGDKSGLILMEDLAMRLGKERCRWVKYPDGCKDLNDVFLKHGKEGVDSLLKDSSWYPVNGIYKLSELPPIPEPDVYRVGMGSLDDHLGIREGDFSVVTGIPSHGKSTFVNDVMCRLVRKHNKKIAFASFEQPPQTDHRRALIRWYLNGEYETPETIKKAEEWINQNFVFIVKEDEEDASMDWVLDKCRACAIRYDVDVIVIDPWNEVDHKKGFSESSTDYVGEAIKKIKRFAKIYSVHMMVVAHPTKITPMNNGNLPVPSLYQIEDTRHWYGKCDVGIVVHRKENISIIRVAKSRYHDILGTTGQVPFRYSPITGRFDEAEDIDQI